MFYGLFNILVVRSSNRYKGFRIYIHYSYIKRFFDFQIVIELNVYPTYCFCRRDRAFNGSIGDFNRCSPMYKLQRY